MDFDPMLLPPVIRASFFTQMALAQQVRLANPQPDYVAMQQAHPGGLMCPMDGIAVSFGRETTDFVLRHHELFSSAVDMPLGNVRPLIPLNIDPPKHSKYRKILDPLFSPKRMDEMEPDIAARANKFIDEFVADGECNFSEQFAEQFPSAVFLGLMGMPWDQLEMFLHLRDGILHPEKVDPAAEADFTVRFAVMNATGQEIYTYFNEQLDQREANPADDLLTHFITAEVDGDTMSREEVLDLCYLFLIAGLDTVSDSLTCLFAYLAQHPEQRQLIVDDPRVIPGAVEELLRWETPVPYGVPRVATQDVQLPNGTTLAEGTVVTVSYGGANIDPSEYPDGFDVRFDRDDNRHIAFGGGVHRCLGSHLARRELRIALAEWHRRIPQYGIKPGHEDLQFPLGLRHVKDLTLSWS
ncbi:MAG: cytochrome P450 [Actinomycetota bacterium]|nr:cytochrome P450 [Actinomycetota bacterium]